MAARWRARRPRIWLVGSALLALATAACKDDSSPLNVVPLESMAASVVSTQNGQTATVNTNVGEAPSVLVSDRFGNPVPDVLVRFEVVSGGGSVKAADTTDASGVARVSWKLGTVAGTNTLRAVSDGLDTLTFTAEGLPGPPTAVFAVAGDDQSATVTEELPDTLVAEPRDSYGNPTPGVTVLWTPDDTSARVSPRAAETDASGRAYATWTLGKSSGVKFVRLRAGTVGQGAFTAMADADAPASLAVFAGDAQTGPAGAALPKAVAVRVLDQYGNGVTGVRVDWAITGGSGSLDPDTSTTDIVGVARTRWIVGTTEGVTESVSASYGGLTPVQLTAEVGPPDNLVIDGFYLTQSAQNYQNSVSLMAGRDGYLRVFALAGAPNAHRTRVAVYFYQNGVLVRTDTLSRTDEETPQTADPSTLQSTLLNSWNVLVPGSLIQPGLAIVAEADPGNEVYESNEGDNFYPSGGAIQPLDVRTLATFEATLVPLNVSGPQGTSTGNVTEANKNSYVGNAYNMLPLPGYDVQVRAVYSPSAGDLREISNWSTILEEVSMLRVDDGSTRYYYGVIGSLPGAAYCGLGYLGFPAAIGLDSCGGETAAHEWGHNWNRRHAPCGGPAGVDGSYPYGNASIGVWGMDVARGTLRSPLAYVDLMSYCTPEWVSDYTYDGVLEFRDAEAGAAAAAGMATRVPSVVVWGRIEGERLVLEPTFETTTVPQLPTRPGPYRLEGTSRDGGTLFSVSFDAREIDHLPDGRRHFAFAIPADVARPAELASVRLAAPGSALRPVEVRRIPDVPTALAMRATPIGSGSVRLEWDADRYPLAIVRSAETGRVLSFARRPGALIRADVNELDVTLAPGVGAFEPREPIR